MAFDLLSAVEKWDLDYAAGLGATSAPSERRPFARILNNLTSTATIRYQPYQNDIVHDYPTKLSRWLAQFDDADQPCAFLLASRMLYVTQSQLEALQRLLFTAHLRRILLDAVIARRGLTPYSYETASTYLDEEMDATLFVANSSSSQINAFVHVNAEYFRDRGRRRLVGPDVQLWTYPRARIEDHRRPLKKIERLVAHHFEKRVLATDRYLEGKRRLVVVEDFSGSGSDLVKTLNQLAASELPFDEVVLAPAMITQYAHTRLADACSRKPKRRYVVVSPYIIQHRFRCFNTNVIPPSPEASYLDGTGPLPELAKAVETLSDKVHATRLASPPSPHAPLHADDRHGFGGLALAFAFYTNCPDNTLPMLWSDTKNHIPLFRRASNYL